MAGDGVKAYATCRYQIFKYAEGAVPGVDEPFEIIDKEEPLTEEQYNTMVNNLGGEV